MGMNTSEIRQKFIEYFKSKDHQHVESSSLVPENDPTLLFTNAGMNQFKDVFLGKESRSYRRATTYQKVVRAGGKHNDLENVGYTARHHTFFEMLGNFSFGDYFKSEAIAFAWEFSTKVLGLPLERLYVTVFREDDEAADIWHREQGVPLDRIFRMDEKDNFWQMGDTGPCGPCTELFVDRGEKYSCGKADCAVGCDCDRYVEFWNLVFMQYERDSSGKLKPLPKPSVDTGAGLERIAMIMQEADTNYDTDAFKSIIDGISKLCKQPYRPDAKDKATVAFRVIADHARSTSFLICDGVIPSNEGRGYVLRRIIRRAVRYGKALGFEETFLHKVCGVVIEQMQSAFPELKDRRSFIERCVQAEEEQFFRTLEKGLDILADEIKKLGGKKQISGEVAFRLYDTYGFPLDLTALIARESHVAIDEKGFEEQMEAQKNRSRKHWKGGEAGVEAVFHQVLEQLRQAQSSIDFVGYNVESAVGPCVAIIDRDHQQSALVTSFKGKNCQLVFQTTPFYGESGGQVGDRGKIRGHGVNATVVDVQRPLPDLIVADVEVHEGSLFVGQSYEQIVDPVHRSLVRRNHTATHLLHHALRKVLGEHVKQAGSLVTPEMMRFDFTHFQALSPEQLMEIEDLVNHQIWLGRDVDVSEKTKDQAVADGAIAFFGEKYGETVRVVKAGEFSVELCGGTHVSNTADIQMFRVISEGAIASGVRRIVALTSKGAFEYLRERDIESRYVRETLKANNIDEVTQRLERMFESEKTLRRKIEQFEAKNISEMVGEWISSAEVHGEAKLILQKLPANSAGVKYLRDIAEMIRGRDSKVIAVLTMGVPDDGKAFVLVARHAKEFSFVNANQIVQKMAEVVGGKGGGKPDLAQAGGTLIDQLDEASKLAKKAVLEALNA
jgi:alanyl-tRNA synthetase